ncbi:RNA polymerase sigma factor [Bizionia gelidisalsuginis]|uniref:RNA polymerase sigma factor n=2 Tax=Bizionia TaxID=283785 RepID=A0A8H2QKW9_9FLAO|nr:MULTISPECIES: RNA polymerase sigma factor [Bizionia]TYB72588.1 RNA polymerase sigma factor [Bizionia saleffrena]TYC18168.1 RNA polymerase sigma factor [Bizionia gelidisalsuginis]
MILTKQNTEALIVLCKAKDHSAQLEIYNRYYSAMYNTAFRIVKDSFNAEDIMQDAFLLAFTKLDTLKDCNTFGAWLKRIVINKSIYHFNKNKKENTIPLDDILYKTEDNTGITSDYEYTTLQAQQIIKVMNTLKDNYRIALSLHLIEGYDYEEISQIMNITYANCRTIISRAKEKLRKKIHAL